MTPKTSRTLPGPEPRKDSERDTQQAVIEDADKTDNKDRDLVHGDGGTIGIPAKPRNLSRDD
ncbi:hypothetical protein [Bradyrhizobium sp. WSM3983]|uniref:hypothetical protein n=1 Tax=Bradyrhizobium sp. WSM3983 TaxID=1038867 RepID=UPI0003F6007C|nr:hypothetical protein [Bradyrhizobium sp. WSM3983]